MPPPRCSTQLAANATGLAGGLVEPVLGDLAEPATWPSTEVDVVVAAFNLVCNLTDPVAQATAVHLRRRGARARRAPGGRDVPPGCGGAP